MFARFGTTLSYRRVRIWPSKVALRIRMGRYKRERERERERGGKRERGREGERERQDGLRDVPDWYNYIPNSSTMATPVGPPQLYNTGLCDCCADCGICCWCVREIPSPRDTPINSDGQNSGHKSTLHPTRPTDSLDCSFAHLSPGDTGAVAGSSATRRRNWTERRATRTPGAAAAVCCIMSPTYSASRDSRDAWSARDFARSIIYKARIARRAVRTRAVVPVRLAKTLVKSDQGKRRG